MRKKEWKKEAKQLRKTCRAMDAANGLLASELGDAKMRSGRECELEKEKDLAIMQVAQKDQFIKGLNEKIASLERSTTDVGAMHELVEQNAKFQKLVDAQGDVATLCEEQKEEIDNLRKRVAALSSDNERLTRNHNMCVGDKGEMECKLIYLEAIYKELESSYKKLEAELLVSRNHSKRLLETTK